MVDDRTGPPPSVADDGSALRDTALRAFLEHATQQVEQLERSIRSLPRVDSKGRSDCPFADELFACKDRLQAAVETVVAELRRHLLALNRNVERCQRNLDRVRAGAGKLQTPQAIEAFDGAEQAAFAVYQNAVTDRDEVLMTFTRAQAVLQVARGRQRTAGSHRPGQPRTSLPRAGSHGFSRPKAPAAGLDPVLQGLFDLGPIGGGNR